MRNLTLDEAIKHCQEVAEKLDEKAKTLTFPHLPTEMKECRECAADHRQLAEWLTDYKELKNSVGAVKLSNMKEALELIRDYKAEVMPAKHGRWIETHISLCKWIPEDEKEEGHSFYMAEMKCSCCERYNTVTFALTLNKPDFCQLCGARMEGAKK